jgi:hypothetical protein
MYQHIFYYRSFNRFYDLICLQNINNWHFSVRMSLKPQIKTSYRCSLLTVVLCLLPFLCTTISSQGDTLKFWDNPTSLHRGRFFTAAAAGMVGYAGTLITLNELWYKQYPRTGFHFFDDAHEWQQMDKAGHMFTAYFEADWLYGLTRWTGMKRKPGMWTSALLASTLQATVEMLDGFSSKWGFSVYDFGSNLAGSGMWLGQQIAWDEQRIRLKMSTTHRAYPDDVVFGVPSGQMTIRERTDELFGTTIFESFLKDYNAQTVWLSVNPHSFMHENSTFPRWLNVAVGYGAENMYGGFENTWEEGANTFTLSEGTYPQYRQWYLSPDIDLSKINTNSKALKTLLNMLNIFKIPAPALEINGDGKVRWLWLHF